MKKTQEAEKHHGNFFLIMKVICEDAVIKKWFE